jgi:hypothetical protein
MGVGAAPHPRLYPWEGDQPVGAGVGDKVDTIDDCWDYHDCFWGITCSGIWYYIVGWVIWGVLKKYEAFEMLGNTCAVTHCHISENLIPKVHATLADHREVLASSVWWPDSLTSTISRFDTHQSWQNTQFSSKMEPCLITASLFLMHHMKCSLYIGLGRWDNHLSSKITSF